MKRDLRFSLRALFVVVTAICVFMAYEVQWIKKRREFILQVHYGQDWRAYRHEVWSGQNVMHLEPFYSGRGGPYLLWMFGENSAEFIPLFFKSYDDSISVKYGVYSIHRSHPLIKRVTGLFPEARIDIHIESAPWIEQVEIVD